MTTEPINDLWMQGYDAAIADLAAFVKSKRFKPKPVAESIPDAAQGRLRLARIGACKSQEQVAAEMAGLGFEWHQSTVNKIESGTRKIAASELIPLGSLLGVDPLELIR
jgi:hypothetical protein